MDVLLIVVLAIFLLFISFQIFVYLKSKKSVGSKIDYSKIDESISEEIKNQKALIYFYTPTCHNCKTQKPIIEKLKSEMKNILSVDASKLTKTARTFNVMGTPSLVLISDNQIKGYYVGVKSEKFILEKLNSI